MSAIETLRTAAATIEARAAMRDQPNGERSMARAVAGFNALLGYSLTERDGWLFMALVKVARAGSTATGIPDDYVDGAAYMALAGEAVTHG